MKIMNEKKKKMKKKTININKTHVKCQQFD